MQEPRTTEEGYQSATNTTDLTVDVNHRTDVDWMIASGWTKRQLGSELMRLRAEWDGSEMPRLSRARSAHEIAEGLPRIAKKDRVGKVKESLDVEQAKRLREAEAARLHALYVAAMHTKMDTLKTLPKVRDKLNQTAVKLGAKGDAGDLVMAALLYWLKAQCPVCEGRKWERHQDAPTLTAKPCKACRGTGQRQAPQGFVALRLLGVMDSCASESAAFISKVLHSRK